MIRQVVQAGVFWHTERWLGGVSLTVKGAGEPTYILLTPGEARRLAAELNTLAGKEPPTLEKETR